MTNADVDNNDNVNVLSVPCGLVFFLSFISTVKLSNKERFDKEQIGIKEPFPVTNLPFTS